MTALEYFIGQLEISMASKRDTVVLSSDMVRKMIDEYETLLKENDLLKHAQKVFFEENYPEVCDDWSDK